ncbi:response regulator [Primorskyibacter sp. S87]|uniref:response regulator n=1 Tax=Primorskyibacter sp. S87 TaxID=3415126 RepID=UPI003C7EB095
MNAELNGNDRFQRKLEQRAQKHTKLSVLVVDDEPSILELLKTALVALENYDVSIANSAASALKTIKRQKKPFDCLLFDIQMPDVDGIQLLEEVRKHPDYADTPVIMLTAMADRKYVDEAFLAGASDYVTKPFELLELRSRMTTATRLVQERQKTRRSADEAIQLKEELEHNQQFNIDDPITIEGVDRFLRYVEFDNYIMQLSHGRLFSSNAIAFKLQDAEFFYDMTNCGDFRRVLQDVATGIAKTTRDIGSILTYRGNGVFLSVTHGRLSPTDYPNEETLNHIVGTLLGSRRSNAWVHVLVGQKVPLRSLSRSGALSALNKAVDSVGVREAELQAELELECETGRRAVVGGSPHSRRRVYERVLRELFGEETYLHQK